MNCAEFAGLKQNLLDGLLAEDVAEQAREHVAGCEGCRSALASLGRLRQALRELPPEPLPSSLQVRVLRALVAAAPCTDPPEIMTLPEVAAYLRLAEPDVRAALAEIPHFTVAGQTRFRRESLERWIGRLESRPADLGLTGPILTLVTSETGPGALAV